MSQLEATASPPAPAQTSSDDGAAQTPLLHKVAKFVIWTIVIVLVVGVLEFIGVDITGWLDSVWKNIGSVPPLYIVAALTFKTAESGLTAVAWMNVLRATYPDKHVSYKLALGAYQGGIGINAIAPAKAGTWTMLGLFRLYIPGSKLATIISALAVQSIAYGVFSAVNYIALFIAKPDAVGEGTSIFDTIWSYISARPELVILIVVCGGLLIAIAVRAFWVKITGLKAQLIAGGAILRTPGRYLTHVFAPALLSYVCRWIYTGIFMAAFGIPVTIYTIFLVIAGHALAGAIAVTPGGLGTTQAIDAVVLRPYTSSSNATAYSLSQDAILTAWNVVFGLLAMSWAFGWSETKQLVRDRKQVSARMAEERTEEATEETQPPASPAALGAAAPPVGSTSDGQTSVVSAEPRLD